MIRTASKVAQAPVLSESELERLPTPVQRPSYDRKKTQVGIAHMSLGAFHRSHQAMYTDDVLGMEPGPWGISGIGALASDQGLVDSLKSQDLLYSVSMSDAQETKVRVIGALREVQILPGNASSILKRLSDDATKIFSLTVTEKGYCYNPQTGQLDEQNPGVIHDLKNPANPQTAAGLIVAALGQRYEAGKPPFTVLSCDNLPGNGHRTRSIVAAFARLRDEKLANWIEANVAFPNTMVDRITPVTTAADKARLTEAFGYQDDALVVSEPFRQWILEDHFPLGRPAWERAGAQFVSDVHPYELAKIRLLNVVHTLLAYPAYLMGYIYVHEGTQDPLLARYARTVMDDEITSTLLSVPGLDLDVYKSKVLERFSNPAILDTWERICSDGSQKISNQLIPIVYERLAKGQSVSGLALLIAIWFRYLTGEQNDKTVYAIHDPMADRLRKLAQAGGSNPDMLLAVREIFGNDVMQKKEFVDQVRNYLADIYEKGVKQVVKSRYDRSI